ncbi:MAG: hypothetical protein NT094_02610 [Candidatus Staskawiczbacteria bacterium]|nr:hypothetical protein [Candidatus Staskawiczbacteria bacterium]
MKLGEMPKSGGDLPPNQAEQTANLDTAAPLSEPESVTPESAVPTPERRVLDETLIPAIKDEGTVRKILLKEPQSPEDPSVNVNPDAPYQEPKTKENPFPMSVNEGTARKDLYETPETSTANSPAGIPDYVLGQPGVEVAKEIVQTPEAESVEAKFDYKKEMDRITERYDMRRKAWLGAVDDAFGGKKRYETWKDHGGDNGPKAIGHEQERLVSMAQALREKNIEINTEKEAAMKELNKKKDDLLMKKIEAI